MNHTRDFVKMSDILKPCQVGSARVDIFEIKENNMYAIMREGIAPGLYARLMVNGSVMMSETPMEMRTNRRFILDAYGDVLIGGLGIGMVIMAIQNDPAINSITVIEENQDVIDAVLPQLPLNSKVTVVKGDVFKYKPSKKFDCVYMDIWPYVNQDVYEEMKTLKRKYGHYLKPLATSPERFNRCWAENYAKTGGRLY